MRHVRSVLETKETYFSAVLQCVCSDSGHPVLHCVVGILGAAICVAVLQCVCSDLGHPVLHCVVGILSAAICVAVTLHRAVCCSVLQYCNVLYCVVGILSAAVCCSVLQRVAV